MRFNNLDKLDKFAISFTTIIGVIAVCFFTWFLWPEPKSPEMGVDHGRGGRGDIVKIEEGRGERMGRENAPPMEEGGRPNIEVGRLEGE